MPARRANELAEIWALKAENRRLRIVSIGLLGRLELALEQKCKDPQVLLSWAVDLQVETTVEAIKEQALRPHLVP